MAKEREHTPQLQAPTVCGIELNLLRKLPILGRLYYLDKTATLGNIREFRTALTTIPHSAKEHYARIIDATVKIGDTEELLFYLAYSWNMPKEQAVNYQIQCMRNQAKRIEASGITQTDHPLYEGNPTALYELADDIETSWTTQTPLQEVRNARRAAQTQKDSPIEQPEQTIMEEEVA